MNRFTNIKQERVNLRLQNIAKELLEKAASFEGQTLSGFILKCALEQAEEVVQKHEVMKLNKQDSELFFDALDNPSHCNESLSKAFDEYAKRVTSK